MLISKDIDPGRVGISKSLITTPCERQGIYRETVRDAKGWRLEFPMPERVVFGSAIDEATGYIVFHASRGTDWTPEEAVKLGIARAQKRPSTVTDWETFGLQVANAIHLFLDQPDGWERLSAELDGIRIQGMDGESLAHDGAIGTPDFILADWSVLDVKTWGARPSATKFVKSPEMAFYAWLVANVTGGIIPPRLIYLAYIRTQKPYWHWMETPGTGDLVALGAAHLDHWRALMANPDPRLAAVSTFGCGDCGYRDPLPEYGHDGCAIGRFMPIEEEAA